MCGKKRRAHVGCSPTSASCAVICQCCIVADADGAEAGQIVPISYFSQPSGPCHKSWPSRQELELHTDIEQLHRRLHAGGLACAAHAVATNSMFGTRLCAQEAGDQIDIHSQAANGQRGHINFDMVARKMGTRSRDQCLDKWYRQLAPSMLEQGMPQPCTSCRAESVSTLLVGVCPVCAWQLGCQHWTLHWEDLRHERQPWSWIMTAL